MGMTIAPESAQSMARNENSVTTELISPSESVIV
jgi:hypothetical protein